MNPKTMTAISLGAGTVTKSDTADIPKVNGRFPRALFCNGAGDVKVMATDETTAIFTVVAGQQIDVQAKRVYSTGSTITASIVPMY